MGLFVYLNQRYQQNQEMFLGQHASLSVDDPHQFIGNSPLLAPHGAPANPKWQTKFSTGVTASIKQDQMYTTTTTTNNYNDYHHGY